MAATVAASTQRIEIVSDQRRAHDAAFRGRVVAESNMAGARVQEVARRHGICTSLVYRWRRVATPQAAGSAVQLLPVRVVEPRPAKRQAEPPPPAAPRRSGIIEIELDGGIRLRVDGEVSLAALRRVVAALRG